MKTTLLLLALCSYCTQVHSAEADKQIATLAQISGKAQIFTQPSKNPHPDAQKQSATMAFFEGQYYLIKDARVGDRVGNNNIVRTLPGSQTRVIYDNGDQFYVGSGTAYKIAWNEKKEDPAIMKFMYGRLRGVISKEGPRKKLTIRTHAAVMGVRGTDFYIADSGPEGETEISVLRGAVDVETPAGRKSLIKTGMSASIHEKTEIRETTKEDLGGIQIASTLPTSDIKPSTTILELEKKAIEVTVKDIQLYQPELFKKLNKNIDQINSVQDLNFKAVALVAETAPPAPLKRRKPKITELKETDSADYYDKYFKEQK
jgi:hypothetical protein